ncbi:MAG: hypothetical protein QG600_120 [Patescibacteria group bacterium]|nr:hypothetical protein [Patescibacteria group bacterium]
MIIVSLFFLQLLALFFLSRKVHKQISSFFFYLTNNIHKTVHIMAFLFFPGTFVHEVSHYLMAKLLFVPAGNMTLLPKIEDDGVRLGSVMIGKSDPIRRLFIGVAPFLIGTSIILTTLFIAEEYQLWNNFFYILLTILVLFQITNTMFSSKKDLEGAVWFVIIISAITIVLYLTGARVSLSDFERIFTEHLINLFYQGVVYLTIPLIIDIVIIICFSSLVYLLQKR